MSKVGRLVRVGVVVGLLAAFAVACVPPPGPPGPAPTPTDRIAANNTQACAVTGAGVLKCWGAGYLGVAGTTGHIQRLAATTITGVSGVVAVGIGVDSTCAVQSSGTVRCWGANSVGQLGDGTTVDHEEPADVTGVTGAIGVSVSPNNHACAVLANGRVQCWGNNNHGQLGDGSTVNRSTPVEVIGITTATQVSVSSFHSCALLADQTVRCWGSGTGFELGNGLNVDQSTPVAVIGLPPTTVITTGGRNGGAGYGFTCALSTDGTEWCWGRFGPPSPNQALPQPTGVGGLVDISGDCAIAADRSVTCATSDAWVPVPGATGAADVVSISDSSSMCVLRTDGGVQCRGANNGGRLGNGFGSFVATPQPPVTGLSTAVEVASGDGHTCARLVSGSVSCWGNGVLGQRGDGTTSFQAAPTLVSGMGDAVAIGAGEFSACAVRSGGSVWCWGTFGGVAASDTPVQVSGITDAVALDGGQGFVCALRSTGGIACWGNNQNGELGNGTTDSSPTPTPVTGITDAIGLTAGFNHACALHAGGSVSCWGRNASGEVGDGTSDQRMTPVAVAGLSGVMSLGAGFGSTCAVLASGGVSCWGGNAAGLGVPGWSPDLSLPAPVPGITNAVQATIETQHLCVTRADGSVNCIGWNGFYGVMGNGTYLGGSTVPVQPIGLPATSAVTSGSGHACALAPAGTVQCWGYDVDNQLGDGGPYDQATFGPVTGLP